MKKVYTLLLCALSIGGTSSFAQTLPNNSFETWRTGTAGALPPVAITAPNSWNSFDSLIISGLQQFGALLFGGYQPTDLHAQLFQETNMTHVHSGTKSAKIMNRWQDTLHVMPGSLANADAGINMSGIGGSGGLADAIAFTGGTATNLRITSVSAYYQYMPGKDSITGAFGGNDSGVILIQASSSASGVPTVVGTGRMVVGAASSFTLATVNVVYTDTVNFVDTIRVIFTSGRGYNDLDSSTMYVDDVTMTGVAQIPPIVSVANQNVNNDVVKVYPNPATGTLYFSSLQNKGALSCELISVSGQVVATQALTGYDAVNVASLPTGTYFYTITDAKGNKVQRGNVSIKN